MVELSIMNFKTITRKRVCARILFCSLILGFVLSALLPHLFQICKKNISAAVPTTNTILYQSMQSGNFFEIRMRTGAGKTVYWHLGKLRFRPEIAQYNSLMSADGFIDRLLPYVPEVYDTAYVMSDGFPCVDRFRVLRQTNNNNNNNNNNNFDGGVIIEINRWQIYVAYTPYWPGIIVNVLFWTCIVAGCVVMKKIIVYKLRRHKRRCVSCGYSLKGLVDLTVCPECGHSGPPCRPTTTSTAWAE